jgi:hypothetical protein
MRYAALLIVAVAVLPSCSAWDIIKPSKGISVDTEIVAGDKSQEVATGAVVGTRETTTNTAETIQQTYNTVHQGKSIWDLFLMMLMAFMVGWLAMPSTRQMWLMIKKHIF